MDAVSPRVEDLDKGSLRPERSPEDKLVSSYLEDHSEIYRDLEKVQNDVSEPRLLRTGKPSLTFRAGMEQSPSRYLLQKTTAQGRQSESKGNLGLLQNNV